MSSSSTLSGVCSSLEAQGRVVTTPCDGRLAEFDWTDGRIGFVFTTVDGAVTLTFMGDGTKRTRQDAGTSTQPIELMFNSIGTRASTEPAVGTCSISAEPGAAVTISCEAETASGRFASRFTSDGQPPRTRIAGQ